MLLCAGAAAASADLAGGLLACPSCPAGRLRPWGHGREREIRLLNGRRERLRPCRGRCGSCNRSHMLLPSWCAPRRADGTEVTGTGLALALGGTGSRRTGREPGVPAATARGWLRRLRPRAQEMRRHAMARLGFTGGSDPVLPAPAASPPGDALAAVAACAHAAITRHGHGRAGLWPLPGQFGLARFLTPAPG